MTGSWRRRLTVAVAAWLVLAALSLWLRATSHLLVLGLVVFGVLAVAWLCVDVAGSTAVPSWSPSSVLPRQLDRGRDVRVGQLRRAVVDALSPGSVPEDRLRPVLTDLVDERLRSHHGLDLTASPTRLRPLLGGDLADYLRGQDPAPLTAERLSLLVDRIEEL